MPDRGVSGFPAASVSDREFDLIRADRRVGVLSFVGLVDCGITIPFLIVMEGRGIREFAEPVAEIGFTGSCPGFLPVHHQ